MNGINLSKDLQKILSEYTDEVLKAVNEAVDETAENTVNELKSSGEFKNRTGKYRRSWTVKDGSYKLGVQSKIVRNRRFQLSHLLEYGHVTRNGKRTRGFPHIRKARENAIKDFERNIKKRL